MPDELTRTNSNTYQAWTEIDAMLNQPIPPEFIHEPDRNIKGRWWSGSVCKQRLNQIFGPGAWSSEVLDHGHFTAPGRNGHELHAWAVVKLAVTAISDNGEPHTECRTDIGAASAIPNREGIISSQQIRTAIMGASTFALKRAAAQLGRALGGQLYHDDDEAEALWPEAFVGKEEVEGQRTVRSSKDGGDSEPEQSNKKDDGPTFPVPVAVDGKIEFFGKSLDKDEKVNPARMANWLREKLFELQEFKDKGRGRNKYLKNHLNKWFDVDDLDGLTWEQAAALFHFADTGNRPAPWYTVKVSAEADDIDAIAEMADFMMKNKIPESLVKDLAETFFDGKDLTADEAKLLFRAMSTVFDKHGMNGLVDKKGEPSATIVSVLGVLVAEATKEPPF